MYKNIPIDVKKLLHWFRGQQRILPWRQHGVTPYRVWVSELMLQQTQVNKVIPYFEKFMQRFPTIESVLTAKESDILVLWSGLGYYSRARNFYKALQLIRTCHGGNLPKTSQEWSTLPGVGRYTLGAVRSIAYHEPLPVLDGNVFRVMTRFLGWKMQRGCLADEKKLWSYLEQLFQQHSLIRENPGDVNQALMEIGATICTPQQPQCLACPLRRQCVAYRTGHQEKYPLAKKAIVKKAVTLLIGWYETPQGVLICQRAAHGLWASMWALPAVEVFSRDLESATKILNSQLKEYQLDKIKIQHTNMKIKRTLTHRQVTFLVANIQAHRQKISDNQMKKLGCQIVNKEHLLSYLPAAFGAVAKQINSE